MAGLRLAVGAMWLLGLLLPAACPLPVRSASYRAAPPNVGWPATPPPLGSAGGWAQEGDPPSLHRRGAPPVEPLRSTPVGTTTPAYRGLLLREWARWGLLGGLALLWRVVRRSGGQSSTRGVPLHSAAHLSPLSAIVWRAAASMGQVEEGPSCFLAEAAEAGAGAALRDRFQGVARLYGPAALGRLSGAHVCVVGLGGVGSWCAEALARSGVGRLTLVDFDEVCVTNVNRQLHALDSTVGRFKADVLAARVRDINPAAEVHVLLQFVTSDNAMELVARGFDVVVDCIDDAFEKCPLIAACVARDVAVVVVGAAGGLADPTQVCAADLVRATNDDLLAHTRKLLRRQRGYPSTERPWAAEHWGIGAVFSKEVTKAARSANAVGGLRKCDAAYGTSAFVTGTFGLVAAGVVVQMLATGDIRRPASFLPGHPLGPVFPS